MMKMTVKKRLIAWGLLFVSSYLFALDLELTQGVNASFPLGITGFGGDGPAMEFSNVVNNDLRMSGQFKLIVPSYDAVTVEYWKHLGADTVLSGRVSSIGGNRFGVHVELSDIAAGGRLLLARDYQVNEAAMRGLAHHVSDEIYQQLTGERGIFSTRIAYVLVQRRGDIARYSLEVADVDSSNPRSLLLSTAPIMSPAWSPNGRQIAYVSFEKTRAQIFTVDVETGKRRLLTDFPGINGAPAWSPDGRQLAVVLSKSGNPKIYTVDLANGMMKQVTFGDAIDTEPRFSPDGQSILFTSGRGGSPQVYKLILASGAVSRMTFEGNYNAKASFTPNQQQVVMLHRDDRAFNIGVLQISHGVITALTDSPLDESPSIAPNGRLVLYATHYQDKGVLAIVSLDGRVRMRLPARDGDVQEPAWSPYLG